MQASRNLVQYSHHHCNACDSNSHVNEEDREAMEKVGQLEGENVHKLQSHQHRNHVRLLLWHKLIRGIREGQRRPATKCCRLVCSSQLFQPHPLSRALHSILPPAFLPPPCHRQLMILWSLSTLSTYWVVFNMEG